MILVRPCGGVEFGLEYRTGDFGSVLAGLFDLQSRGIKGRLILHVEHISAGCNGQLHWRRIKQITFRGSFFNGVQDRPDVVLA